jgi:predicted peptidase
MIVSFSGLGTTKESTSIDFAVYSKSRYEYLLYLPRDYPNGEKKWPLMIYLHGSSRRGSDIEKLKKYGPPAMIKRGKDFPFIIASPQCPVGESWNNDKWFGRLFKELTHKYRIDTDRVYLIGMSLGGSGVWYTARKFPDYFAAIIPICGGGDPRLICRIKHIPVWAFHGAQDKVVPPEKSKAMVDALKKCGGEVQLTLLKNRGHDIHEVFHDYKIYKWLLKHKRN